MLALMDFPSRMGSVKTDAQGKFTLPHLPQGPEQLRISVKGYAPKAMDDLDLTEPPESPIRVVMNRGGTIRGLVFDGNGKRVAGRAVHLQNGFYGSEYKRGRLAAATTNETGFFQAENLKEQQAWIATGDEWRGTGVVRRTVLPRNGESSRFGSAAGLPPGERSTSTGSQSQTLNCCLPVRAPTRES